jgi:hypothetical protein
LEEQLASLSLVQAEFTARQSVLEGRLDAIETLFFNRTHEEDGASSQQSERAYYGSAVHE